MADKMLIDATHAEETRVVVLRGNRVEEFDFESANRKQLRGNIYLAKVTRVEPSLQAAFIDYGGNRHGFLAFSEIHPDYYQIPVADRQALIAQEESDARQADADADHRASRRGGGRNRHRNQRSDRPRDAVRSEPVAGDEHHEHAADVEHHAEEHHAGETAPETGPQTAEQIAETAAALPTLEPSEAALEAQDAKDEAREAYEAPAGDIETTPAAERASQMTPAPEGGEDHGESGDHLPPDAATGGDNHSPEGVHAEEANNGGEHGEEHHEEEHVESVGGADALEEAQERAPRFRRQYKIQEVIKRRQVMLVQVVKEERGSKGAALTTYLSLAGRYSVLMPNTARGGGISRKITSGEDRSRLKEIAQELEVPEGMGVILRTAGASRTKLEVKRDFEYLLRQWETVRDLTLKSMAPKLVYEEGSLTKRSIRDLYTKEIDEIVVAGEAGYKEAREFMRMLMPSHAKNVKYYKDSTPLFTRYGIESQLDAMFSPTVQLRSGGYIVINQTEALVAIDVNSGRATREHHIEDTALKTNCEAADEVARQLRLRDLAGLIVIDFIDMDEGRNNRAVERRMKDALKHDRARIQVGRISHFGLLEMSRQRIRTSVLESSTEKCPVCGGSGHVRSVSSVALQLLRAVEEMLNKGATHNLIVRTRSEVALYVLNHKRAHLRALEERFRIIITISADATVNAQVSYIVDRGELMHTPEAAKAIAATAPQMISTLDADEDILDAAAEADMEEDPEAGETFEGGTETNIEEIGGHEDAPDEIHAGEPVEHAGAGASPRDGERDGGRRRRRRGRGRGRGGEPRENGPRENGAPRDYAPPYEPAPVQSVAQDELNGGVLEDSEAPPRHEGAAPNGEGSDTPEGRRRRRRGRRGGRRNRHRNGDAPFNPNEAAPDSGSHNLPPVSEEDASGFAPPFDNNASAPAAASYAPAPEAKPAYAPVEAAPSQEPQRRRSTIREPAPIGAAAATPGAPPPAPVISVTATTEPAAPKRGWWGKRLLGDKD